MSDESKRYTEALQRFSGDLRMSRQVFQSMRDRGVPIEPIHRELLLHAHLDARDLDGVDRLVAEMTAEGTPPDVATRWTIAVAAARGGRTGYALTQLDALHGEGHVPEPAHAQTVLTTYLAAGRHPAARSVLRQMTARGQAASDQDYASLLRDCLERRAIKDTRSILDQMLQVDRRPDARLATELVKMVARAGHTDRAAELIRMLTDAGVRLPGDVHTELLLSHARSGDATSAEAALEAMRAAGAEPSSFHVNAVLQARIASEDVDGAWTTALDLVGRGRIPSGENLEGLGRISLAKGRLAAASGVVDWMLILGVPVPPQLLADVLSGHLAKGEMDAAIHVYETSAAKGVPADRRVARELVDGLVKADRLDDASALLERLRAAGTLTHGRHYGPLLQALLRRQPDAAIALLGTMLDTGIVPVAADASRVVGHVLKAGQLDEADRLVERLVAASVPVDEPTFRDLLWAHAKKGQAAQAREVFDRMIAAGITPEERHRKALGWATGETRRRLPDGPTDDTDAPTTGEQVAAGITVPTGDDAPATAEPVGVDTPVETEAPVEEAADAAPVVAEEPEPVVAEEPEAPEESGVSEEPGTSEESS